ncbi:demethylmenaquinone methyltransferase [Fusarium subglutinans]|uniref:Demethylmenaquinone methyltransferase n=1 Tax=Gibberella subglutinans TaxID=42677 RepID=A0A8H5P4N6_GIBSU|nr:demethylmenaquinone methyltransferase [Fusarium subglutinans]KAF5588038.1 demethylmenaquinone methyltransferase [Fusarium subglutinans]
MADQTAQSPNPAEIPSSPTVVSAPQQTELIAANDEHDDEVEDDADSTLGADAEFADRHPNVEIVGTDLSPCQPEWVPPNVRFEIDDAALSWTWGPDEFDFIHIRYIFGAIKDWSALFSEAYRCCVPGGWVQSAEADVEFRCDDGTIDKEPNLKIYKKLFEEGAKILGNPFFVYDQQVQGFKDAGFEDITTVDYKIPVGDWPKDPKLAEVGRFVRACYTTMMWNDVLKWPKDEYQLFLMSIRKAIKNPRIHTYMRVRYVYGRKPSSP